MECPAFVSELPRTRSPVDGIGKFCEGKNGSGLSQSVGVSTTYSNYAAAASESVTVLITAYYVLYRTLTR